MGTGFATSGVWSEVLEEREIYLYPVTETRKYHIVYSVDSDVTVAQTGKDVAYDASGWALDVPTCDGYSFLGWYMLGENGNRIVLTDNRGIGQINWRYTGSDEYTVYALWNSVLRYRYEVGISYETVDYNKSFDLAVPDDTATSVFVGWYIEVDEVEIMITDAAGHSLAPWKYDGKKEYYVIPKWRSNE